MWQCKYAGKYAKEPFDLKLFVLHGLKMVKWILLSAFIGALCIGGGYYLKNVTFGGQIPYVITRKLDVDYILYGTSPDLEKIHFLCKSEGIRKENNRKAIGF